jgi:hypothetical protein
MPVSVAPSAGQRPRHGNRTRRIAPAAETYAPVGMPIFRTVQAPLSTVARRLWRDRVQQACVRLVGVLGFNRQPVPHSCHVDQNGLNSRIWRAGRHLPAFNGVLSAYHRGNHCGAARRRTSRPKPNYTTTIAVSVGSSVRRPEKISKSVSRVPGRQRGLLDRTIKIRRGGRPSPPCRIFTNPTTCFPVGFILCGAGSVSVGCIAMGHEAKKYLGYARECARQAGQAHTEERRGKLIELARVWMAAALNEEAAKRKRPSPSGLPRIAS